MLVEMNQTLAGCSRLGLPETSIVSLQHGRQITMFGSKLRVSKTRPIFCETGLPLDNPTEGGSPGRRVLTRTHSHRHLRWAGDARLF